MIIVTGAAGFIGSCLVNELNNKGFDKIVIVDDFSNPLKNKNIAGKTFIEKVERKVFFKWLENNYKDAEFIYHLGARTDTTEFNMAVFDELNLNYSKSVWECCTKYNIPLVYASSAATYGMGEFGYDDDYKLIDKLMPLNPYGVSKNEFDKWVIRQEKQPPFWAGLKFFNVYGPNEYHKGRMASVIFHAYNQIKETGKVKLFRSHNPEFEDGKQIRDFIYVKDVVNICYFFLINISSLPASSFQLPASGIYNVGTGKARTFLDLAKATFHAMNLPENIIFIDTPADIRDKYQYFTEAKTERLHSAGYDTKFYTLEEGIYDYVDSYLTPNLYY
jgi:ADP-L-glycero-D-manno-heptose 6-epimerase